MHAAKKTKRLIKKAKHKIGRKRRSIKRRGAKRRNAKRTVGRVPIAAKLPSSVVTFLKKSKAKVEPLGHRTVFTAFDAASTLKVDIASVGKTLVMQGGGDTIVAVVPANCNVDIKALTKVVNAHRTRHEKKPSGKLTFTSERAIKSRLKAVPGAVPPFGPLLGIEAFIDKKMTKPRTVVVSGGNFESSLALTPTELLRLSEGILGSFSAVRPK